MRYQGKFTPAQLETIREYRKGLIDRTFKVPEQGAIVEHQGRPGNYYFVLPGVFQPNEGCIPLLENYVIRHRDDVLDFGTGSGVIAIDAAKKGANFVIGVDINKNAIRSAKINSIISRLDDRTEFNDWAHANYKVIAANLPFTDEPSINIEDRAAYDPNLESHKQLFNLAKESLYNNGRIYLAQANFGAVDEVLQMANKEGFSHKLIGRKKAFWNTPVEFYAFELRRKV